VTAGKLFPKPSFLPQFDVGALRVTTAHTAILLLGPVLVAGLAWFLSRTRLGLSMRAAAANPDAALLAGVSSKRMSTLAWAIAGAVAAFTAVLVLPTRGFASLQFLGPGLLLRALAAAVIARMDRLPVALAAGVGIGVVEAVILWNNSQGGVADATLFALILVALLVQRKLQSRGAEGSWLAVQPWPPLPARLRRVWAIRHLGWLVAGAATLVGIFVPIVATNATSITTAVVLAFALVGLSVGVITGLSGQLSLGQFAFAGVGAAVGATVAGSAGHLVGLLAGGLVAAAVSVVIGLPALRVRGLLLAVTTLAFALVTQSWLLQQTWMLGDGKNPGRPTIAGFHFDTGKRYVLFALAVFLVGLWLVRNIWVSGVGRRLRAVRDDERAAQAFTVPATRVKLEAFALAGFLAGVGGAVYGFALSQVDAAAFPVGASFDTAAMAVIGGLGVLAGPVIGAFYIAGLPQYLPLDNAGLAATAFGWLLLVLYVPGGIGQLLRPIRTWLVTVLARAAGEAPPGEREVDDEVAIGLDADAVVHRVLPVPEVAPGEVILRVDGLRRHFGGVVAVDDVSLEVRAGEVLGLIGPNGAGKTTLFELIGGFTRADAGSVVDAGRDITRLGPEARARLGLVRSFQDAALFPTMTVHECVQVALERSAPTNFLRCLAGMERGAAKAARADALVELMGLRSFRDAPVAELSTGTRRITELACLIALEPTVLLLDEPAAGIAQRETEALGDLLVRIKEMLGLTLVIVEHDIPMIMRLSDRVIAMETGTIIADGTPAEVRDDPLVIASYLGDDVRAVERSGATSR
jgi:ABC-type branched-subunit amino acid transport system ATPase component/ABC-type branched-subunit amino acid transport system permease subunit